MHLIPLSSPTELGKALSLRRIVKEPDGDGPNATTPSVQVRSARG